MKKTFTLIALALASATVLADAPAKLQGGMLVGGNGMTLYVFDKDEAASAFDRPMRRSA